MALTRVQRTGRAAFTLIELLVVIGLMAVLATISVTGYSAASRGMADRGVIQTTVSTLRIAQQTCQIDRVPTKVLFFNQRLTDTSNNDDATLYQGTAIAIKQSGRITIAPSAVGGLLVDEFADWHQSYPMRGSDNAPGMRLYRMRTDDESKDIDGCSVLVKPFVTHFALNDWMIQSGRRIDQWCTDHRRTASDNRPEGAPASYVNNANNYVWGFAASTSGSGASLTTASWQAGDPYGVEIARLDLPKGYIFGTSLPSGNKLVAASIKEVSFDPEELTPLFSGNVPISAMRPMAGGTVGPKLVDTVTSSMLKDTNN